MSFSEGRGPELPRVVGAAGGPALKDHKPSFWTGASVLQQNSPSWQRKSRFLIRATSLGLALYFTLAVDWREQQTKKGEGAFSNVLSDFQDLVRPYVPTRFGGGTTPAEDEKDPRTQGAPPPAPTR